MMFQGYWPVPHPLDQYVEDVIQLAKDNGLKIYDPSKQSMHHSYHGKIFPTLTLKTEENTQKLLNIESKPKRTKKVK